MAISKKAILSIMLAVLVLGACGAKDQTGSKEGHASGHAVPEPSADSGHGDHGGHGDGHGDEGGEANGPLQASFTFAAGKAAAGETTELDIQINDNEGRPVGSFDLNHEKLLHLIAVSKDLSSFSHIHPDYEGDGRFTVETAFPTGGEYKLFADFVPSGGAGTVLKGTVGVEGEGPAPKALTPEENRVKIVDGKEIELVPSHTKPNEGVTLAFTIKDAATGEGIDNLQPYLGAVGHVVILSEDGEQYLHVHPLDEQATGPVAEFGTSFPQSGIYKLWGQFQHEGEVFTVPFVVEVK